MSLLSRTSSVFNDVVKEFITIIVVPDSDCIGPDVGSSRDCYYYCSPVDSDHAAITLIWSSDHFVLLLEVVGEGSGLIHLLKFKTSNISLKILITDHDLNYRFLKYSHHLLVY